MGWEYSTQPFFDASVTATAELARGRTTSVHTLEVQNPNAIDVYLQLFNAVAAANVTLGTTTPDQSYLIPGNGVSDKLFYTPLRFMLGLVYAVTTTATGSTAPGSAAVLNMGLS